MTPSDTLSPFFGVPKKKDVHRKEGRHSDHDDAPMLAGGDDIPPLVPGNRCTGEDPEGEPSAVGTPAFWQELRMDIRRLANCQCARKKNRPD